MTITNNALTSFEYDIWLHGWPHVNTSLINKNLVTIAWMTCHYSNPSTFISDDMEWMRWQITSRVCYNFWHANYFFVSFLFKTNFAHLFHYSKAPFYAISRWLFKLQTILYIYSYRFDRLLQCSITIVQYVQYGLKDQYHSFILLWFFTRLPSFKMQSVRNILTLFPVWHVYTLKFFCNDPWLYQTCVALWLFYWKLRYIDVMKINLVFLSFYNFSGWMRRSYIFLLCCRLKLVRTIKMKSSPTV